LIQRWIDYPWWVILILLLLWMIKDAILFPYMWRAYDPKGEDGRLHIGSEGVVVKDLEPEGYVQIRGELWRARVEKGRPVQEGEKVRVQKVEGLTLIVALDSNESEGSN
jgi:membrane-bound serine protease (ClpP class)